MSRDGAASQRVLFCVGRAGFLHPLRLDSSVGQSEKQTDSGLACWVIFLMAQSVRTQVLVPPCLLWWGLSVCVLPHGAPWDSGLIIKRGGKGGDCTNHKSLFICRTKGFPGASMGVPQVSPPQGRSRQEHPGFPGDLATPWQQ
jgi:hypothetical protein